VKGRGMVLGEDISDNSFHIFWNLLILLHDVSHYGSAQANQLAFMYPSEKANHCNENIHNLSSKPQQNINDCPHHRPMLFCRNKVLCHAVIQ
jgi:hypothetical protein